MKYQTKKISYDQRARFFFVLGIISVLALLVYMLAVVSTSQNIAQRQNLEREISIIEPKINSLEFRRIELKNEVTIEIARSYGFQEVKDPLYVSRVPSASLSFNTIR